MVITGRAHYFHDVIYIHWNRYFLSCFYRTANDNNPIIIKIDVGFQGVKRLMIFAFSDVYGDAIKLKGVFIKSISFPDWQ